MSIHVTPPSGAQSRPLAAFPDLAALPVPPDRLPSLRASLSAHIERCIALLDAVDGDFDLEHNGDLEPWLAGAQNGTAAGLDCEEDGDDLEPSLGAIEFGPDRESQVAWGHAGNDQDLEQDDGDSGIADRDGLYEQGFTPGRGLELLREEAEAARATTRALARIIARLSGVPERDPYAVCNIR